MPVVEGKVPDIPEATQMHSNIHHSLTGYSNWISYLLYINSLIIWSMHVWEQIDHSWPERKM